MATLRIIGTSHIARQSVDSTRRVIEETRPDIVAVELDPKRLTALMNKGTAKGKIRYRDILRVGVKGWLFAMIGSWATKKLGSKVGVAPGSDMLEGVKAGKSIGAKVCLIDQDIEVTLKKFSKALSWKEKGNFVADIIKGVFFKKGIKFDVSRVPSKKLIKKLLAEVKVRYPNIYRVLVEERNHYMARRLAWLLFRHPNSNIVAVVGAGHEDELSVLVQKYLYELTSRDNKKDGSTKLSKQS